MSIPGKMIIIMGALSRTRPENPAANYFQKKETTEGKPGS
jgi:hypothetical protein